MEKNQQINTHASRISAKLGHANKEIFTFEEIKQNRLQLVTDASC